MQTRLLGAGDEAQWAALVVASPHSGVMQTPAWGRVEARRGCSVLRLGLYDEGDLVGGAQFYGPPAGTPRGLGFLHVPHGPVLPWDDQRRAARGLGLLRERALEVAVGSVIGVHIEPWLAHVLPSTSGGWARYVAPPVPRALRNYERAQIDTLPLHTLCLDLRKGEAGLLAEMHPKTRYNIGLAARRGVSVRRGAATDLSLFYRALSEAARRDDFRLEDLEFFRALLEELVPGGLAQLLIAEHEGDALGALLLTTCGARATYLYGATTDAKRTLMGGYALQWGAIQAALTAGCSVYDFYGYEPFGLPDHQYASFSEFKRKFGGYVERNIGAYAHVVPARLADVFVGMHCEIGVRGASHESHSYEHCALG